MINVGQKAPDFKLVDINKNEVSLSDFKGKTLILFFFPMAGTGVCTKEACAMQDDFKTYQGLGANVVGISVDTFFALNWFAEKNKINFPLLSDFSKKTIRDYDIVNPEFGVGYKDVAKRATFVIDKDGIVKFVEILPAPGDFPNLDAIKDAVRKLSGATVN